MKTLTKVTLNSLPVTLSVFSRMFRIILYCVILSLTIFNKSYFKFFASGKTYEPTWKSLNSRPIPQWYDDVKVGIFLHWGVYSVPSIQDEWFWYNWKGMLQVYSCFTAAEFIKIVTDFSWKTTICVSHETELPS